VAILKVSVIKRICVALLPIIFLPEPLWNISKSEPVPYIDFTLSLCILLPVNVLPVLRAKSPVVVTPSTQALPV
tara:strand:+ start:2527 stop:2748 length:222 start_codon:yes stop_codon:yes gene_type:complete